jgi:hypothetical protein
VAGGADIRRAQTTVAEAECSTPFVAPRVNQNLWANLQPDSMWLVISRVGPALDVAFHEEPTEEFDLGQSKIALDKSLTLVEHSTKGAELVESGCLSRPLSLEQRGRERSCMEVARHKGQRLQELVSLTRGHRG